MSDPEPASLFEPDDSQLGLFASEPEPAVEQVPESEPAVEQADEPPPERADEPPPEPRPVLPPRAAPAPAVPKPDAEPIDLLEGIVGQPAAVGMLRSALGAPVPSYLFVGGSAADLRDAACRFAGELLAQHSDRPNAQRHLALALKHPDVTIFDRIGQALTAEQAREVVRAAPMKPTGSHKVLIVCEAHLANLTAPMLLKVVEEPTPSTSFIITAESITQPLVTLASRCVQINFVAVSVDDIRHQLVAEGCDEAVAGLCATSANGSLDRARLLAADDNTASRLQLWRDACERLDGSGGAAVQLAEELLAAIEAAAAPLRERQDAEAADEAAEAERYQLDRSLSSTTDARHKRELRRHQADEVEMGLLALTETLRQRAAAGATAGAAAGAAAGATGGATATALAAVGDVREALFRNANLKAALASAFLKLGR